MATGFGPRLIVWTWIFSGEGVKGSSDESLMVALTEPRMALIPTQNRVKTKLYYSSLGEAIYIQI